MLQSMPAVRLSITFLVVLWLGGCCGVLGEADRERSFQAPTRAALDAEQRQAIAELLRDGRLGALPDSARDIRFGSWAGMFSGERCLRFEADPAEIQGLVESSPSLAGEEPERFGAGRHNLPSTERTPEIGLGHRYYQPDPAFPWYAPTLRGAAGRRYRIRPDASHHNWGEVVIDDERNVVYANVMWD